ncbi:MAG: PRTRC system protein A [Betaproteobacteria bacterium]|jgi:PRTRC genetic system protein A|nr:PRTRC system protein A [Betaproteobacteria bacterium]
MHTLDAYWAKQVPVLPAPAYSALQLLNTSGHRVLVAKSGTYAEVCRPWLYAMVCIGSNNGFALPFGELNETLEVTQRIPRALLGEFQAQAQAALPNETAAWIVWHETNGYRLVPLVETVADTVQVKFQRPELTASEHLVLDLHSHGVLPAFFSSTDDQDDLGEVKLSAVVGEVGSAKPSWVLRLCLLGSQVPWSDPNTLFTE